MLEQVYSCSLAEFPELISISEHAGPRYKEPLEFQLHLQRTGQLVKVDGYLDAVVTLKCGRCLQDFEQSVSESFSFTFVPQLKDIESGEEFELEADELGLIVYHDEVLELQDPLQEQLMMAIPISPVCKSSCRGLCPECGANLNINECGCVRKPFNNKFTLLAGIDFKKT